MHLEPYMSHDNAALNRDFKESVCPGSSEVASASQQSPADFLLGCISTSTCSTYYSYIASIPTLTNNSARQLAVDISYLGDILDDLGHPLTGDLTSTAVLLRVQPESWNVECSGHNPKVVAMVHQLRGLSK